MSKDHKAQNRDFIYYITLAQIRVAIDQELDEKYIQNILEQGYDIHYKLPASKFLKLWKPDLINHSALDFIAVPLDMHGPPYKLRIIKVLLKNGVNFLQKDSEGSTIIHKIFDYHFDLLKQIWEGQAKDEIVDFILSIHVKTNDPRNPCDKSGVSHLHIACVANNVEAVELFLNNGASVSDSVYLDSPKYPGYTPLHFAARFHSHDVVRVLMKRNADLHAKDTKGMSPLQLLMDLAVESTECVNTLLIAPTYNYGEFLAVGNMIGCILRLANENSDVNFMDDTGFSLMHAASVMTDVSVIEYYLEMGCDINAALLMDSSVRPGYTSLHFAAHFKNDAFKLLFQSGGNIEIKDSKGVTPFDLFVTRSKIADIHSILSAHPTWKSIILSDGKMNLIDFVWALRGLREFEAYLDYTNIDINAIVPIESSLWPGHSLLHLAVLFRETHEISSEYHENEFGDNVPERVISYAKKVMLLMSRGADVNARDARGLTAWDFVSHLDCDFIKSYLRNLRVQRVLSSDENISPGYSHFSWESRVIMSLISGGEWNRSTYDEFMANPDQQKQMQQKVGLTVLHVACWELNVDRVEEILKVSAADVNTRIDSGTTYWPGYTPLHLLMKKYAIQSENEDKVDAILQLLLDNGADVMLTDAMNCSPIHLTEDRIESFGKGRLNNSSCYANERTELREYRDSPYTGLLFKLLTDFSLNITNSYGISHFHIACIRNEVDVIQQFLKFGVDVNEPVDYFSDKYVGLTPLHLAMIPGPFVDASSRLKTVEVLLMHGADVNLVDSNGNTALHTVARSTLPREDLLEKLLWSGADINAKNLFGETALELLLLTKDFTVEEIEAFHKRGCEIYNFNPLNQKGYLSTIFRVRDDEDNKASRMKQLPSALNEVLDVTKLDHLNRTIIHNFISDDKSYIEPDLIEYFIDHGCDIDHQDNLGRTALHMAVEFQNPDMVETLLNAGADVNILDAEGYSAFALGLKCYDTYRHKVDNYPYDFQFDLENEQLPKIIRVFSKHLYKMQFCGLDVSDHVADVQQNAFEKFSLNDLKMENFLKQIDKVRNIKFGKSTLTAYDFLSRSSRVITYRLASPEICQEIDEFFKSDSGRQLQHELNEIFYVVKTSYKKAMERSLLLRPARDALQTLVRFPLLEICSQVILKFLTTKDLKNLIAAMV